MGHFWQLMEATRGQTLRKWVEEVPNDGIIRYLDIFNMERLAIVSPAALGEVLVQKNYDFEKPLQLRKGISRILGTGLFLAEGETHKRQRKHLMPAFAYRHVKNLYPMFWDKSKELVRTLLISIQDSNARDTFENVTVVVNDWASRATLDIIGDGGFGHSFDAIKNPSNELNQTYRSIFAPGRTGQMLGILGFFLPQWFVRRLPILRNDQMKRASSFIRATCHAILDTKRQKQYKGDLPGVDILTVATESGAFSDDDLVDQMMTFLAAGHETTASALTWAIYLLVKHPQVQTRLRAEVQTHLPSPFAEQSIVTSESIEQLPYLQAVCREALRLFPPVALTIRVAVIDSSIQGHFIPKGTTIMLPPWAVNTSSALWGPSATKFQPERWMNAGSTSSDGSIGSNYDYLTFLHGPRSCIGQSFAVGELACLLAAWIGSFETKLEDENYVPKIRGGITSKPKDGLRVHLKLAGTW